MRFFSLLLLVLSLACSADPHAEPRGATSYFEPDADFTRPVSFYDFPFPSDLRFDSAGHPDLRGLPLPPKQTLVSDLQRIAQQRKGFPVIAVAYFRFNQPLAARDPESVMPALASSPVLLLNVDEASPDYGRLHPTVAKLLEPDGYTPDNVLAVAARPGVVLLPRTKYAFIVQRDLRDAEGRRLGQPTVLAQLLDGVAPSGRRGSQTKAVYEPLRKALRKINLAASEVAVATVFTTGDVVADTAALTDAILAKYTVEIRELRVDPVDGATHDRFCELVGKVRYPQFQHGLPPFDKNGDDQVGLFDTADGGLPSLQREEDAPITITLPKQPMPPAGYPLTVYFHGSGGLSSQVVDRGPVLVPGGKPTVGQGPAYVLAPFGIAAAGSALPVNPERLANAAETAYLNLDNPAAFRDTFRQGVIEQRMFIAALRKLRIDPSLVSTCTGLALPVGETAYHFDESALLAMGQSMGGMYTNLVGSVEPRIRAVVPTGAGGFWAYFILRTSLISGANELLALILNTKAKLTFMHPAMHVLTMAWEPVEPLVYMPRLGRNPLPNHPVRPIYEPVGKDDSYFPTTLYDAIAIAYEHPQAGDVIWPSMQDALATVGLDGVLSYPVKNNRISRSGDTPYTGVVVQYEGDGIYDPHSIYAQLDSVKYQYGCFFSTFLKTGVAVVPAPAALGTACPE